MHAKVTLFAVAILLLALVTLVPTLQLPSAEDVSTFIGPRLWPLSLVITLLVLGSTLLVITLKSAKDGSSDQASQSSSGASEEDTRSPSRQRLSLSATRHWWLMGGTLAYTLLMQVTGYFIATVVFTLACTLLLGARHWGVILATVIIAAVLIQGVFVSLLGIPLP